MKTHREVAELDGIFTTIEVEDKVTTFQKCCDLAICGIALIVIFVFFN